MRVICAIVLLIIHHTHSLTTSGRPNSKFSEKFSAHSRILTPPEVEKQQVQVMMMIILIMMMIMIVIMIMMIIMKTTIMITIIIS